MGEVLKSQGAQILKVMNGKVIWTSDKRIAVLFNNLRNNNKREAGYQTIKWTLFKELPSDNLGERVAGMGDS